MNEKQKGGKRENAGRKPTSDPKLPITIYVETSKIEKNGGRVTLAQRLIEMVDSDFVANPVVERNSVPREKKTKVTNLNTEAEQTNRTIDTTRPYFKNKLEEQIWEEQQKILNKNGK